MSSEFDIIKRYFQRPSTHNKTVITPSGDDCAIVAPPREHQLAITMDALIEDIHFHTSTRPEDIAYKAVAVSISDLAACGATPLWITGHLGLKSQNTEWLTHFSKGLFDASKTFECELIGGDLTRAPKTIVTITAHGAVPNGKALLRSHAKPNDLIYVSGTLGLPALALKHLKKEQQIDEHDFILARKKLDRPTPRLALGQALHGLATACIDVSDGLLGDIKHIMNASTCGATLHVDHLPIDTIVRQHLSQKEATTLALTGGDEYELCFTLSPEKVNAVKRLSDTLQLPLTCIGTITQATTLSVQHTNGNAFDITSLQGFEHF